MEIIHKGHEGHKFLLFFRVLCVLCEDGVDRQRSHRREE